MSGFMPWDSAIDLLKIGIEKIWPDKTAAQKAKAALEQAQLQGSLKDLEAQWNNASAQLEVNKQEAVSPLRVETILHWDEEIVEGRMGLEKNELFI